MDKVFPNSFIHLIFLYDTIKAYLANHKIFHLDILTPSSVSEDSFAPSESSAGISVLFVILCNKIINGKSQSVGCLYSPYKINLILCNITFGKKKQIFLKPVNTLCNAVLNILPHNCKTLKESLIKSFNLLIYARLQGIRKKSLVK